VDGTRVSRSSQIPLYHQIANDLRERILGGTLAAGARIPSEQELGLLYGASRITVRQALGTLAHEGLVSREPGRGSFVRDTSITAGPRRLTSFTSEMRARGIQPTSRVLSIRVEPADDAVAAGLSVDPGTSVLRLERLRSGDEQPLGIQTTYLRAADVPGLEKVDFDDLSLYQELERRHGILVDEAEETFVVSLLDADAASLLAVPPGSPAFVVERIGVSNGRVVEFTRSVMRGDRYRVQIRLRRTGRGSRAVLAPAT
jgi:GntR family transcriptional regulator